MKQEIVWVTGAGSGIGKGIALAFASRGHRVLATGRDIKKLKIVESQGEGNIITAACDMSSYHSITTFLKSSPFCDGISILINNAGITSFTLAEEDSPELAEKMIATNLTGAIHAIQGVLPGMISRRDGLIVNILSVITQKVFTRSSLYSATKSGLQAYAKVLREEVRRYNIRVMNVSPGATDTPIWAEEMREKYSERMMHPDAIGELVYELCFLKGNAVAEEIVLRPPLGDL